MTKKLAFKLPEENFANLIFGLLVAFMLYAIPLSAQKARFEFFTAANGLAGNNTSTVTQDEQGFLWFVNSGKLHRFDVRNFVIYPPAAEFVYFFTNRSNVSFGKQ